MLRSKSKLIKKICKALESEFYSFYYLNILAQLNEKFRPLGKRQVKIYITEVMEA